MRNRQIVMNCFWILTGAILMIASNFGNLDELYSGFGAGFLAVGLLQLIRNIKYRTNKEYQEKVDIEISDERNKYLRMRAWSYAGYLFVLISGIACIVCMVLSQTLYMEIASYAVCLMLILYLVSYAILKKKY